MRKAITVNNAKHETGHWISGWILEKASHDIVIATTDFGDSYCDRAPHPDFNNLSQINSHLSNRIINLISGAKAESFVCGEFNKDIYRDLVSDYKGAWPDFFIASELFRYYYRTLQPSDRMSFEDEWDRLVEKTERIIKQHEDFIGNVCNEVLRRFSEEHSQITISQADMLDMLNSCS